MSPIVRPMQASDLDAVAAIEVTEEEMLTARMADADD